MAEAKMCAAKRWSNGNLVEGNGLRESGGKNGLSKKAKEIV